MAENATRAPGFYWVRVPSGRRLAVAEWSPDTDPGRWALPGIPDGFTDAQVEVMSRRIVSPVEH
jgi:hypothetical protein